MTDPTGLSFVISGPGEDTVVWNEGTKEAVNTNTGRTVDPNANIPDRGRSSSGTPSEPGGLVVNQNAVAATRNAMLTAALAVATGLYGGLFELGIVPQPPALPKDVSFPLFDGFLLGATWDVTLPAGSLFDRYGNPRGSFASPVGTPKAARALPPWNSGEYTLYKARVDLEVKAGIAGPYYGSKGGGIQYKFEGTLGSLLDDELVEVIE